MTTYIAQTSREVKKEYKKNGTRMTDQQRRLLERGHELDLRAVRSRELDDRKRAARKKREEKERKEREARRQLGVGLATQLAGYSHTQAKMKSGMEAFLGLQKRREEDKRKEADISKKLEVAINSSPEREPWDNSQEGDIAVDDQEANDIWIEDDLDDDSLLEAHDSVMSDVIQGTMESQPGPAELEKPVVSASIPVQEDGKPDDSKDDQDFVRIHGPINKAIEAILKELPGTLIELLSQDISMNLPTWDPAVSLLHKLNPVGIPPHRLRIKVGCEVTLLRDLNTSSQLSRSSQLRILRVEKERLECLVVDGQLAGTKTFLTRVPFTANYRKDDQYLYQRTQFPLRVSTSPSHSILGRDTSQPAFKLPTISGQAHKPAATFKKPAAPASKAKPSSNPNPSFKLPGLPASKAYPPCAKPVPVVSLDGWEDLFDTGTQIARDLSSDDAPEPETPNTYGSLPSQFSTQDFDFSMEDLAEPINSEGSSSKQSHESPPHGPPTLRKALIKPSPKSHERLPIARHRSPTTSTTMSQRHLPPPSITTTCRKSPPVINIPPKPVETCRLSTFAAPRVDIPLKSFGSFEELGLSTQDVASFLDDDELSSPTFGP